MFVRDCIVGAILALSVSTPLAAQATDVEFFEAKIRPVLVQRCYSCHNSKMAAPKGDLILDTKEGLLKGGASGPVLAPGRPADSRLLKVLSYTDPLVQMPPSGKLADAVLEDFAQWVAKGAVGSSRERTGARVRVASVQGHVAGRGPQMVGVPAGRGACRRRKFAPAQGRPVNKIDNFILAKLAEKKLQTLSAGGQAHAGHAGLCRSPGLQADVRGSSGVCERPLAERLREPHRSPAGVAALRRALGPPVDGRGAIRRRQPFIGGDESTVSICMAVPRLDHRSDERRHAVRPFRQAAAGGRSDARREARRHARARICRGRADLSPRPPAFGRRDRHVPDRRLGRADRRGVARRARPVRGVRALPRSQVRSDHAEGLLRADGRVCVDRPRRAADVPGGTGGRAGIHVAAAQAVRPGVFHQPARERRHHLHRRRREGGEVESGDGRPESAGHHQSREVSAARSEPGQILESAAPCGGTTTGCCSRRGQAFRLPQRRRRNPRGRVFRRTTRT